MFGPDYKAGYPSCSAIADGFDGSVVHLANHDVTLAAVSRAPPAKLQAYERRMGGAWWIDVWLTWMLDFRPTVNAMPEKVAQFVETFRRQFNIAKP